MDHRRFRRFLTLGVGVTTLPDIVYPDRAAASARPAEIELEVHGVAGRFPLHAARPLLVVGRSRRCDVRLPDRGVEPQHACVQLFRGGAFFVDLGSRAGTFRDSQRARSGWMRPDKPLRIGPFLLSCRVPPDRGDAEFGCDADDLLSARDFSMFGARPVELVPREARAGDSEPQPRRICRPITLVGRHRRCALRLTQPGVARFHSSLIATPAALWAADLRSGRGTFVNGRRTRFRRLRDGDVLGIGEFRVQVRYPVSPNRAGRKKSAQSVPVLLQQQLLVMSREQTRLMNELLRARSCNGHPDVGADLARVRQIDEQIVELMTQMGSSSNGSAPSADLVASLSDLNEERVRRMAAIMQSLGLNGE